MHRETTSGSPSMERSHSSLVKFNGKVWKQAKWETDAYETKELDDICIFQILQALSTRVAIRTTILSKQWQRVWHLVPVLDFDEKERNLSKKNLGGYYPHQKFVKFVTRCLKCRESDRFLDKFRLRMCHSTCFNEYPTDSCLMDKWIHFAVERNVKELCISPIETSLLGQSSFNVTTTYRLPHTVLASQSITILNLECLTIEVKGNDIPGFSLPSLRSLSLRYVIIDVWGFFNFQSWCPSLEILSIIGGTGFGYQIPIKVSSSSLKYLEVIDHKVKIVEAVNLESFRFGYKTAIGVITGMNYACDINIDSCGGLRNLDIYNATFESAWFEGFDCRFPLLQSLVLYKCCIRSRGFTDQKIRSRGCTDPIVFNAPNLQSFRFSGCGALSLQSFWFSDCRHISFSMNVPKLSEAAIILDDHRDSKKSSSWRRNFLSMFNCCRSVFIYAIDPKALIFREKMRKEKSFCPPLASVKHMEVTIQHDSEAEWIIDSTRFRDSLHWMAPALETLIVNKKWRDDFNQEITSNFRVPNTAEFHY